MGKKSRRVPQAPSVEGEVPVVPGRQPCPCGSGKRYKQCHGLGAGHAANELTPRPFAGLTGEADWVAMREIVPAATATARTIDGTDVTVSTVLPMALAAMHRNDGTILLGLQVQSGSGDPSRDAAAALRQAMDAGPGTPVAPVVTTPGSPTLQDMLDPAVPFTVTLHSAYDFWVDAGAASADDLDPEALKMANETMVPTERLAGVEAAYWCRLSNRPYLRWVLAGDEETTLDGLARLAARRDVAVGAGGRYLGAFRTCGVLVPVWELADNAQPGDVEEPAAAFAARLAQACAVTDPLTADERRARAGVVSRQLTLR